MNRETELWEGQKIRHKKMKKSTYKEICMGIQIKNVVVRGGMGGLSCKNREECEGDEMKRPCARN